MTTLWDMDRVSEAHTKNNNCLLTKRKVVEKELHKITDIPHGPTALYLHSLSGESVGMRASLSQNPAGDVLGSGSKSQGTTLKLSEAAIRHASISYDPVQCTYHLQDLGSQSGTFVGLRSDRVIPLNFSIDNDDEVEHLIRSLNGETELAKVKQISLRGGGDFYLWAARNGLSENVLRALHSNGLSSWTALQNSARQFLSRLLSSSVSARKGDPLELLANCNLNNFVDGLVEESQNSTFNSNILTHASTMEADEMCHMQLHTAIALWHKRLAPVFSHFQDAVSRSRDVDTYPCLWGAIASQFMTMDQLFNAQSSDSYTQRCTSGSDIKLSAEDQFYLKVALADKALYNDESILTKVLLVEFVRNESVFEVVWPSFGAYVAPNAHFRRRQVVESDLSQIAANLDLSNPLQLLSSLEWTVTTEDFLIFSNQHSTARFRQKLQANYINNSHRYHNQQSHSDFQNNPAYTMKQVLSYLDSSMRPSVRIVSTNLSFTLRYSPKTDTWSLSMPPNLCKNISGASMAALKENWLNQLDDHSEDRAYFRLPSHYSHTLCPGDFVSFSKDDRNLFCIERFPVQLSAEQGWRATMEDEEIVTQHDHSCVLSAHAPMSFFAVFDGHAGQATATFAKHRLPLHFVNNVNKTLTNNMSSASLTATIAQSLRVAFHTTDAEFLEQRRLTNTNAGCTAIFSVVMGGSLFVANAGDSRAVLCRDGVAVDMSIDHKPTVDSEAHRIRTGGGQVAYGRVGGRLAVSRALGDADFKASREAWEGSDQNVVQKALINSLARSKMYRPTGGPVTSTPEIRYETLQENDQFLLLACDGLYDVFTSQEAVDFILRHMRESTTHSANDPFLLHKISEKLVHSAVVDKHSRDNVTVLIVPLNHIPFDNSNHKSHNINIQNTRLSHTFPHSHANYL